MAAIEDLNSDDPIHQPYALRDRGGSAGLLNRERHKSAKREYSRSVAQGNAFQRPIWS
jgi:hypothetical protein